MTWTNCLRGNNTYRIPIRHSNGDVLVMPSLQMVRNVLGLNALAPSDRGTGKEFLRCGSGALCLPGCLDRPGGLGSRGRSKQSVGFFWRQGNSPNSGTAGSSAPAVAALAILYTIGASGTAALIMLAAALLGGLFGFPIRNAAARELALPNLAHYPLRSILGVIGFTRRIRPGRNDRGRGNKPWSSREPRPGAGFR